MTIDRIDGDVLDDAQMLRAMFDDATPSAIERRVAWAIDSRRVEQALYWLKVRSALHGEPIRPPR